MNKAPRSPAPDGSDQDIIPKDRERGGVFSKAASAKGAPVMLGILLLVEDFAPMREVIGNIVDRQFGSIHEVEHGDEVVARAAKVRPDTIVLDISLPGTGGLVLLPLLRKAHPAANIVMLTNHGEDLYRRQASARGADAYVLKSRAHQDLLPAIRAGRRQTPAEELSGCYAMA